MAANPPPTGGWPLSTEGNNQTPGDNNFPLNSNNPTIMYPAQTEEQQSQQPATAGNTADDNAVFDSLWNTFQILGYQAPNIAAQEQPQPGPTTNIEAPQPSHEQYSEQPMNEPAPTTQPASGPGRGNWGAHNYYNRDPRRQIRGPTGHDVEMLGEFVDDGPRKEGESTTGYNARISRARRNMGIERLEYPPVPPRPEGQSKEERRKIILKRHFDLNLERKAHDSKMDPKSSKFDRHYRSEWLREKAARKERNKRARRVALERKRKFYEAQGFPRPETPEPPEDSGDELYAKRLRLQYTGDNFRGRGSEQQEDQGGGGERTDPPASRCQRCADVKQKCDLSSKGYPCTRCESTNFRCFNEFRGDNLATYRPRARKFRTKYLGLKSSVLSSPPRRSARSRSASPMPEPCDNCRRNPPRVCTRGRPCGPCILYQERHLCDQSVQDQSYGVQPRMDEDYDMTAFADTGMDDAFGPSPSQPGFAAGVPEAADGQQTQRFTFASALRRIQESTQQQEQPPERPVTPGAVEMAPQTYQQPPQLQISPFQTLRQTQSGGGELSAGWNFAGWQPHDILRKAQQQAQAGHVATPDQEMYNAEVAWTLGNEPRGGHSEAPVHDPVQQEEMENADHVDLFDFVGYAEPQPGLGNNDDLNDIFNDVDLFSAFGVRAPQEAAPADGPLAEAVLQDLPQNIGAAISFDPFPGSGFVQGGMPPTPPASPVLPHIRKARDLEREALDFKDHQSCCEWADAFLQLDPQQRRICNATPSKLCDHLRHSGPFCTCRPCHDDQQVVMKLQQDAIVEMTKAYLCATCALSAQDGRRAHGQLSDVQVEYCLCVGQMRKTWLCNAHRDEALTKVKIRAGLVGEWLLRKSLGRRVCPRCQWADEDRNSGVWGCKSCREVVLENPPA